MFKLNITYEIDEENLQDVRAFAHIVLLEQHVHGCCVPQISLTRDGDRSGANLLAPVGEKHYKHTKISLDEYLEEKGLTRTDK